MSKIPLPEIKVELSSKSYKDRQDRWCQYVYEQILSVIGHDGTLILHSFSYGYIHGKEFDVDRTDSEVGPFTNYVRRLPQAMRSLHPVFSLTGVGKNAKNILSNCGKAGFGSSSPFYRLSKFNTIFVSLGTTIGESMTYIHHLEQMYGVSYRFNQCFSHPVTYKGCDIVGPWLVNLRYLGVEVEPDLKKAEVELIKSGAANMIKGDNIHQSVKISRVDKIVNNMLSKNPAVLITPSVLTKINDRSVTHIEC
jgi:aminoglycoside 3-N-acetyltransferase